jgi:hypothetical protein
MFQLVIKSVIELDDIMNKWKTAVWPDSKQRKRAISTSPTTKGQAKSLNPGSRN